jgi:hypothetical protein
LEFGLATVPFPCIDFEIEFSALNALAVQLMLLASRPVNVSGGFQLLGRNTHRQG